ncbi:hypothetical protein PFICI_01644 [Pestalotiopsis fici W106-1]|uniref:Aminoglycoside phosphotransferase domain-containing protein n=1 Tax=Pestalotiopsis fici (strain W106-1 / CGMCC3.15140) TaxID=1229662 RepID=W3XRH8_PESFW|nr:uncharacterized protein PFICI_01644 [Pestalotiopsis fici W106-1]ETS87816.1 hypothetical protein PFICI_01644 [Pestalotiopsis fici W106-1]
MENDADLVSPRYGVAKLASVFEERMNSPTEEVTKIDAPRRRASSLYSPKTIGPLKDGSSTRPSPPPLSPGPPQLPPHVRPGYKPPSLTSPAIKPSPLAKIVPGYADIGMQTRVPENTSIAIQTIVPEGTNTGTWPSTAEALGTDMSTQTQVPENKNTPTQMEVAEDRSTSTQTDLFESPAIATQTGRPETGYMGTQTIVPESLNTGMQTSPFEPTEVATQTEPFSPSLKTIFALGQSALEKLKRPSWPIYEKVKNNKEGTVVDDADLDDTSTLVEEELPVQLFGTGEFSDPILRALQLQDSVDASRVDSKIAIKERRDTGLALSRATQRWLRQHEPGQRQWPSKDMDSPCAVCHATREDAARSVLDRNLGFCSSLNLKYNDSEQYAWSLGHRYVVVEKQYWRLRSDQLPAEVWASRLLRKHTKVPTPAVAAAWKEGHVAITITERARGRPLAELWESYSGTRRQSVAKQIARCVRQWRRITSPAMSALDGGPCLWVDDAGQDERTIFYSDAAYRDFVRGKLVSRGWDKLMAQMTVDLMPTCQPFVFTHGNLTLDNIFVHEGRVVAITGLGRAAYLPSWAESLATHNVYGQAEREWKEILFRYIGSEGVKTYYDIYEELLGETDNTITKKKTEAIQQKLRVLLAEKTARETAGLEHKNVETSKKEGAEVESLEQTTKGKGTEGSDNADKETTRKDKRRSKRPANIVIMANAGTQTEQGPRDKIIVGLTESDRLSKKPIPKPRRTLAFHGLPFSPQTVKNRSRASVFHPAGDTLASQVYPGGFHILEKKDEIGEYCAIRAIFDSLVAQLPERKGAMSFHDLKLQWDEVKQTAGFEEKQTRKHHFVERLGKTLGRWAMNRPDPMDLCLGCILIDGREWIDGGDDGVPWSDAVIWITTVNAGGKLFFNNADDFRGLRPSRRKLSDPSLSPTFQASPTVLNHVDNSNDGIGEDHKVDKGTGSSEVGNSQDGHRANTDDSASWNHVRNVVFQILEV